MFVGSQINEFLTPSGVIHPTSEGKGQAANEANFLEDEVKYNKNLSEHSH